MHRPLLAVSLFATTTFSSASATRLSMGLTALATAPPVVMRLRGAAAVPPLVAAAAAAARARPICATAPADVDCATAAKAEAASAASAASAAAEKKGELIEGDASVDTAAPVTVQERLRLFWRLALPYFQQAEGAKLNFGLMLLLVLMNSGVSVIFSYVGRDFYSALSAKDQVLFFEKTANYALGLAVATPLTVLYEYHEGH